MNAADQCGYTSLIRAGFCCNYNCLEVLLEAGADVNAATNNAGATALMGSTWNKHKHCEIFVQRMNGEYDPESHSHERCTELLIEAGADVKSRNESCLITMMKAAENNHFKSLDLLIEAGADVNQTGSRSITLLQHAARYGHIECVNSLINAGDNVNTVDKSGNTPLMAAAISGGTSCIRALLKAGCHINRTHANGTNALERHIAESKRQSEKATLLLYAAGETLVSGSVAPPGCLRFDDVRMELKHLAREAVRGRLIRVNPQRHLFDRIPQIKLPETVTSYLLYGMSLEQEEDEHDAGTDSSDDDDDDLGDDDGDGEDEDGDIDDDDNDDDDDDIEEEEENNDNDNDDEDGE